MAFAEVARAGNPLDGYNLPLPPHGQNLELLQVDAFDALNGHRPCHSPAGTRKGHVSG